MLRRVTFTVASLFFSPIYGNEDTIWNTIHKRVSFVVEIYFYLFENVFVD